ncbi:MAG: hypothetical protein ABIE03_01765 [Patescibacteria group bacterium]
MSKTDDIIKRELSSIGNTDTLKRRVYIGSSNHDQDIWAEGGLSFGINGVVYGSNDFAWFADEEWFDPFTQQIVNSSPKIVIEGSHCLNTRSWGNAQLQRFHHAYGALLNNILSIYYLKKGQHEIRHDLMAAALSASEEHSQDPCIRYLITDELSDIKKLVKCYENTTDLKEIIKQIENKMLKTFNRFFLAPPYNGDWKLYLESRDLIKTKYGWVKIRGPRYKNFTDSSFRMGHIVVGEALVSKYLLLKSNIDLQKEKFLYLFPFLEREEFNRINNSRNHDKEWKILVSDKSWNIITVDELVGLNPSFEKELRTTYKNIDLNVERSKRDYAVKIIEEGLLNNSISIKI